MSYLFIADWDLSIQITLFPSHSIWFLSIWYQSIHEGWAKVTSIGAVDGDLRRTIRVHRGLDRHLTSSIYTSFNPIVPPSHQNFPILIEMTDSTKNGLTSFKPKLSNSELRRKKEQGCVITVIRSGPLAMFARKNPSMYWWCTIRKRCNQKSRTTHRWLLWSGCSQRTQLSFPSTRS